MEIDQKYEVVPIDEVQPHPDNPNRGVVELIEESIRENTWYGAIVVQKSTGYILAGNHRWLAAQKLGATEIPVIYKDVDDREALRILLVDNETTRKGSYDDAVLRGVLDQLVEIDGPEGLAGTGFDLAWLEAEADRDEDDEIDVPDDDWQQQYGVIVVCEDEEHQQGVYEMLTAEGLKVRVVTV